MAVACPAIAPVQLGRLGRMTHNPDAVEIAERIARHIGYAFTSPDLLVRALTHSSANSQTIGNYERLEFLGDRVLGLVIADMLWNDFPDADEGELSRRFNLLVNADTCAQVADEINLGDYVITGAEIASARGRKRLNLRADAMEALIAAIYLDGGLEPADAFIRRLWRPLARADDADRRDAKTELQEWAHRVAGSAPTYETQDRSGPDHEPVFTVVAIVSGYDRGKGTGRSKREAEQAAATAILTREGVWPAQGGDR